MVKKQVKEWQAYAANYRTALMTKTVALSHWAGSGALAAAAAVGGPLPSASSRCRNSGRDIADLRRLRGVLKLGRVQPAANMRWLFSFTKRLVTSDSVNITLSY